MKLAEPDFPYAMLQEIHQQPAALRATLDAYTHGATLRSELFSAAHPALPGGNQILIAASGSSRHAGLVAQQLLQDLAELEVRVQYASELIYDSNRAAQIERAHGFLALSQSGETADTLQALREARLRDLPTIAITNHPQSTMAKLAACSLPTHAGQELAIPATKSFTTQLMVVSLLALYAAVARGHLSAITLGEHLRQLRTLPDLLASALPSWTAATAAAAHTFASTRTHLYLGRGVHFAIAQEGALKMKESAYLPALAYPAGELKHGPNALLDEHAAVIVLATKDSASADSELRYQKTLDLVHDLHRQGARMLALATDGDTQLPSLCEQVLFVPAFAERLTPMLEVVPLQLLAYATAAQRGINMDKPRNLSKAVLRE